jgi:hypothetical protein
MEKKGKFMQLPQPLSNSDEERKSYECQNDEEDRIVDTFTPTETGVEEITITSKKIRSTSEKDIKEIEQEDLASKTSQ